LQLEQTKLAYIYIFQNTSSEINFTAEAPGCRLWGHTNTVVNNTLGSNLRTSMFSGEIYIKIKLEKRYF